LDWMLPEVNSRMANSSGGIAGFPPA